MTDSLILAIDQGTSSTKSIIFDGKGKAVIKASEPLKTHYLEAGFVEQDPEEIYSNVLASVKDCIQNFKAGGGIAANIKVCGISNQRETFVIWNKAGKPLYNAVVWQCKRSVDICNDLLQKGLEDEIKSKTGLIIDPYFSGTKLLWLYNNVTEIHNAINNGDAYFGTVDTWLLYKLTKGRSYYTDYTNASRTLFFNLKSLNWDMEILEQFGLSKLNLPEPKPSSFLYGETDFEGLLDHPVSISSMIGDSHAAAFGEGCFNPGTAKATLGTGCSILMNIGNRAKESANGMITTVCWSTEDRVDYAFEGVIVSCGSTIEWLKNELGLFTDSKETDEMAGCVVNNNGVYLIPAFSGLGAPYWQMGRKASISGLTFDCNKNHIVRAALESIAFQIKDVVYAMQEDADINLKELMVNGGITSNNFVLKFLAGLLELPVIKRDMADVSALGAAYLAGLKAGIYKDFEHLASLGDNRTEVKMDNGQQYKTYYQEWKAIVAKE
ncbi:MAG: glycerol kinase GlpK [Sphingobacteriaceae bacterium]|nr:glycerol kinase GlpK [Sphingobacteriaceae bacterium]